jgi:2-oxoglutarate dehydrogenase E2 component (dihydrolipoamide succinyltransferase)
MAIEIKVPPVGESITEVTLSSWKKKTGDSVLRDEIICELESDKATFELPAEADGILNIVAKEGEILPIGGLLCSIETSKLASPPAVAVIEAPIITKSKELTTNNNHTNMAVIEIKVPAVGESITEVTIASWSKKEGDSVKMDEVLCELESDKATFELPAEVAGVLHIVAQPGAVVPIGGLVATIAISGATNNAVANDKTTEIVATSEQKISQENNHAGHPSPVAANILAEKGIDPSTIEGTGVGGKITKEDALQASKPAVVAATVASPPKPSQAVPIIAGSRGERREKMTSLRKTIARRLVAVKNETAMLTTFNEVDMKPIMDLRALYKDKFKEKHGVGLGFMSFFTKAACVALKEFPAVNAKIDGDEIVFNDFCDISIAVSAPKGLMVPVIRNATKAKDNKLTLEEMTGGTFTLTNGGIFGSMLSTPIINAPQVAILGMHNIVERAVVVGGQIVVRPIMYLALSYDHRIIDGKDSVSFLVRLKQLLEDPTRLLLDV